MANEAGIEVLGTLAERIAPAHTALLVVDMQNDYCAPGGAGDRNGRDLSLVQAASALPMLFFGLLGGVTADRVDRRRLVVVTRSAIAVFSMLLAALIAIAAGCCGGGGPRASRPLPTARRRAARQSAAAASGCPATAEPDALDHLLGAFDEFVEFLV